MSCSLIPVVYGQEDVRPLPALFPQIDAWAIPVHKAMNRAGRFRSEDMKDYLGLVPGQKLIFSTSGPDDFMEMLWERGETLDFRGHGFDYWFPAHFSIYDRDSRFYQLVNARRQQIHARRVRSQFVWFRLGEVVPLSWLGPIQTCPSVLISSQQMDSGFSRNLLREEIRAADEFFPVSTAFFFIGSGRGSPLLPERPVYEIHSSWLIGGLKGSDLAGRPQHGVPKVDLLARNLRALHARVCKRRSTG